MTTVVPDTSPLPAPPRRRQPGLLRRLLSDPAPVLDELAENYGPLVGLGAGPMRMAVIGDPAAVEILLRLIADAPPQVRRRAIAAITVFDDPRIEPAITRAAFDRNPGVREAAEMVVGRQIRSEL